MIDIRKLKELVRLMVANDLTEIDLRDSEEQVTLRRHGQEVAPQVVYAAPTAAPAAAVAAAPAAGASAAPAAADDMPVIASPMVGTFYAAGTPDAAPFVSVGAKVGPDTTVCIIEAMKIFNEIKAETSGTIEKVMVKNGESVEFGQPLFVVRPA